MTSFPLSAKYVDFINTVEGVRAEFLEGTTASGKTTVGAGVKFMRMVSRSPKKLHIIASRSVGNAEKNIIQQDNGILDIHHDAVYRGNGNRDYKIPHIAFEGKIIFVLGYDSREKWEMVLGSQFGCVLIDEINTANIDFVREISTRNEYLLATLNPDDPHLPVYKEFVNRSRPFKKYEKDVPSEILHELTEPAVPGWRYWFFTFRDNLSLTQADIEAKKQAAPKGTKLYKNKILGLRGKAEGLVFPNFDEGRHVIDEQWLREQLTVHNMEWLQISSGLDTSYSANSPDTIAMTCQGITMDGTLIILEEQVRNNAETQVPFAPSDVAKEYVKFLDRCARKWGMFRNVFVDSADQATLMELAKYARQNPCVYIFNPSYKTQIIDRINQQLGWLQNGKYLVLRHCPEHIHELNTYSYTEKGVPEDGNDHTINSNQYGWIPYQDKIG